MIVRRKMLSRIYAGLIGPAYILLLLLAFACGERKLVEPDANPFEGIWVEEYDVHWREPFQYQDDGDSLAEKALTSVLIFEDRGFSIKISRVDNDLLLKEVAGDFCTNGDTITFNVSSSHYSYPRMPESIPPETSVGGEYKMGFRFLSIDSLMLYNLPHIDTVTGMVTIRMGGLPWSVTMPLFVWKNSGVFIRQ
jgi:hypothetical protein